MNQDALDEILKDCVAYSRHNAPISILDKWSKEVLAFALDDMTIRLKICKDALRFSHSAGSEPLFPQQVTNNG